MIFFRENADTSIRDDYEHRAESLVDAIEIIQSKQSTVTKMFCHFSFIIQIAR